LVIKYESELVRISLPEGSPEKGPVQLTLYGGVPPDIVEILIEPSLKFEQDEGEGEITPYNVSG
jgi:hypothetical protein